MKAGGVPARLLGMLTIMQFVLACFFGSVAYLALWEPVHGASYPLAIGVGIFGAWASTKLWVLLRYGWRAMRSMSLDP